MPTDYSPPDSPNVYTVPTYGDVIDVVAWSRSLVDDLDSLIRARASLSGATFTGEVDVKSAPLAGSASARQTFISTADPTPADGADGDLWVRYLP